MSLRARKRIAEFDVEGARRAILRYQPASNWLSISRDPTRRMTIGLGFDVSRPEASELLSQVGLDPAAVRSGRTPVSDAQMSELFDLTLLAAVEWARQCVPGFDTMLPKQQWALLELIVWLGPEGAEFAFIELAQLSLPLTHEPLEPSRWFDRPPGRADTEDVASEVRSPPRRSGARRRSEAASATRCRTTFESFGLVAELASDDADLLHAAEEMLPPGWRAVGAQPTVQFGMWTNGLISVDGVEADRIPHRPRALLRLGAIVRHRVAMVAPSFTFVHAGVVDAGGCGIVIPGRSYTGKSTLVAELVRLGATYVSDEYAVLDSGGLVHPFAKPLSIRAGRRDRLGQLVTVPRAQVADHPVRAGLIVLTAYASGAQWRPSVRSSAEGALALLQNTVSARLRPDAAMDATSRLARAAVFLSGQRGEAHDTALALLETALSSTGDSITFRA
jgi:hypothetical protein